jgi:hypothetical protein
MKAGTEFQHQSVIIGLFPDVEEKVWSRWVVDYDRVCIAICPFKRWLEPEHNWRKPAP